MEFIEGKCPKCHEHIQVAPDREKIRCMFCGEEISTEEAVQELARETAPVQSAQGNEHNGLLPVYLLHFQAC